MTANLYGYNLDYNPFFAMGTFEATIYNRVKADLRARGIRNFTDPYYGDPNNTPRTDDRYVQKLVQLCLPLTSPHKQNSEMHYIAIS